jgi:hypothetical protein
VSNLLQLVWEAQQAPTLADFEQTELDAVFGALGWKRVVTALNILTKLKLLTPAKRRAVDDAGGGGGGRSWASRDIWAQCNPSGVRGHTAGLLVRQPVMYGTVVAVASVILKYAAAHHKCLAGGWRQCHQRNQALLNHFTNGCRPRSSVHLTTSSQTSPD